MPEPRNIIHYVQMEDEMIDDFAIEPCQCDIQATHVWVIWNGKRVTANPIFSRQAAATLIVALIQHRIITEPHTPLVLLDRFCALGLVGHATRQDRELADFVLALDESDPTGSSNLLFYRP